ncbi:MAG: YezD family protein [Methylomonas sp.]
MSNGLGSNGLKTDDNKEIALQIASLLQEIRYGSVEVVIHDGRIVQIDKRERFRINEQKSAS